VRARRAPRRSRLPAAREPNPGGTLSQRGHRRDLLSLARSARPARPAAQRDVLPEHAAGMIRARRSVSLLAPCALAAWTGLAHSQITGQPPPPIPPESAQPSAASQPGAGRPPPACDRCGAVESIRQSTTKEEWTSLGNTPSRVGQSDNISPSAVTTFKI